MSYSPESGNHKSPRSIFSRGGLRLRVFMDWERRGSEKGALQRAYNYEAEAKMCPAGQEAHRGKLFLRAGVGYLRAYELNAATENLEEARPYLESYLVQDSFDAYTELLACYQASVSTYWERPEEAAEVFARSNELADAIKEHFDMTVQLFPDGRYSVVAGAVPSN